MKAWRRDGDSLRCAMLSEEADMLANLGRQVLGLHRAVIDRRAVLDDPVMARLYPDAYEGDEDAAEFRRLASSDIAADRIRTMTRMVVDLETALPAEGDDSDDAELQGRCGSCCTCAPARTRPSSRPASPTRTSRSCAT